MPTAMCVLAMTAAVGVAQNPNPEWDAAWPDAEAPILSGQTQLTFDARFVKAGEAYFDPSGTWIIFQAVPVPAEGVEPDEHYSMFVAHLERDPAGDITGLGEVIVISNPGSANTCGWFHPTQMGIVLLGTTTTPPSQGDAPGYSRDSSKYTWKFPAEMEIVEAFVPAVAVSQASARGMRITVAAETPAKPIWTRDGYDAEASWSPAGRFILYTRLEPGSADGDIWIYDALADTHTPLVAEPGYDGGPFFSPDGRRITYRSDRRGDDLLQVFVADLVFDDTGAVTGIANETQLTDNQHMNWCPFFTTDGRYLIYATSRLGHGNYEVFAVEASPPAGRSPVHARVTNARGFDGLPAFNRDGTLMMWTAQRGASAEEGATPSSQIWVAKYDHAALRRAMRSAALDAIEDLPEGPPGP